MTWRNYNNGPALQRDVSVLLEPDPDNAEGIYVHLPFCRAHCTYCPFAVSTDLSQERGYMSALFAEIRTAPPAHADTLYIGGGTPSRSSPAALRELFETIRSRFSLLTGAEVTLEANPEDISVPALDLWLELGVTRLSIGVQSFHDQELAPLGRLHGRDGARAALELARGSGHFSLNVDLILGLPGQTRASFLDSLEQAIDAATDHLSLYLLDLDEDTALRRQIQSGRQVVQPDDDAAEVYLLAVSRLESAGLRQYEISNFSVPGRESRHNLRYWNRSTYRGFGLGAHSFDGERRFANTRDLGEYIFRMTNAGSARDFEETLASDDCRRETLFLSLRRRSGIEESIISSLCGDAAVAWIEEGEEEGWIRREQGRVVLTPRGFLVSNELIARLF